MRILWGASDWSSAWASVLRAMNSTPIISARIIRLTALLPPPPTPITRMSAKFSESDRNAIAAPPGRPHGTAKWGWKCQLRGYRFSGAMAPQEPGESTTGPPRRIVRITAQRADADLREEAPDRIAHPAEDARRGC